MSAALAEPSHEVSGEILIDAPPESVWAVLSDFHRVDVWAPVFTRTVDTGTVAKGIGASRRCYFRGLGSVDEVATEWEEGRRLSYRVSPLGPIDVSMSHWEIEPVEARASRVRLRLAYGTRYGPLGRMLHVLLARRILSRNLPGALALLRREVRSRVAAELS